MPEVSKTEIGRRLFQVHKGKGIETAVKKIRQGIGDDWKLLTQGDIEVLERMLGECWVYLERSDWEKISFSRIDYIDVLHIIEIGNKGDNRDSTDSKAIHEVAGILTRKI